MDLYCQRCGEPWEAYYVQHDMDLDGDPGDAVRFKRGEGCPHCKWGKTAPAKKPFRAEIASVLGDLAGDDIDGLASDLEDAEYFLGRGFWDDE